MKFNFRAFMMNIPTVLEMAQAAGKLAQREATDAFDAGDLEKALSLYHLALSCDENNIETHILLGDAERAYDLFDAAQQSYEAALEIDEFNADARKQLGALYAAQHRYNDAKTQYKMVARHSDDLDAQVQIAKIYEAMNNSSAAIKAYEAILDRGVKATARLFPRKLDKSGRLKYRQEWSHRRTEMASVGFSQAALAVLYIEEGKYASALQLIPSHISTSIRYSAARLVR